VQIAGHVVIHDHARLEGICGIHQFVTIGAYSFIGFMSRITKDVPPYMIMEGSPARERAVNVIGLQRGGFSDTDVALVRKAHKVLYRSGLSIQQKISSLREAPFENNDRIAYLVDCIAASSKGKNGRALQP
jgi:UDP-N-acetylglucosamine acyltransferase